MSELADPPGKRDPIWPTAVIGFGLGLTAVWTILLVYGLVMLVQHAI